VRALRKLVARMDIVAVASTLSVDSTVLVESGRELASVAQYSASSMIYQISPLMG
jgi:hypothetical protein